MAKTYDVNYTAVSNSKYKKDSVTGRNLSVASKITKITHTKRHSWLWELLFIVASVVVGVLTEGIGDLVFGAILAGTELAESTALIIAGTVQTALEVGGQIAINEASGHTDKTSMILAAMPGLGVFGLGRVAKGFKLMKNENLMLKSLIKNGVDEITARQIVQYTSKYVRGKNLQETLFLNAIDNHDVKGVRTFRHKIYRSSGIGIEDKELGKFYFNASKRYGHETIEDLPDLIETRLNKQYDLKWKFKQNKQQLIEIFGKKWVENQEKKDNLDWIMNGLDDFKKAQMRENLLKQQNFWNSRINRPITTFKRITTEVDTKEAIGIKYGIYNSETGEWKYKNYLYDEISEPGIFNNSDDVSILKGPFKPSFDKSHSIETIYKKKKIKKWVKETPEMARSANKEPERLIDYSFKNLRKYSNPLKLIHPPVIVRKATKFIGEKIEKLAVKWKWFDRLISQIKKLDRVVNKINLQLIKRYSLIPAINSPWQIGFRILGGFEALIAVEIFYWNKAQMRVIRVQRELSGYQFEKMIIAYEGGGAGHFYNKELALGWGLKNSWLRTVNITSGLRSLHIQRYLYSSIMAYRNFKSLSKGIQQSKQGSFSNYDWKNGIKNYSSLRAIRMLGSLTGLAIVTNSIGISLYRKKGFLYGNTIILRRLERKYIKRFKRKSYNNPRNKRKYR